MFIIIIITQPHAFISVCRNAHIIIAISSVGQATLQCNQSLIEAYLKEVIQLYAAQFPIFCPLSPQPTAFTGICGNAIHYACDGLRGSREACICNKG